ncbi:unnamed protein product [Debaryomyces tyrocola]|nr:unnamed protein product [Debaryomyces tyrocola]
MHKRVYMTVIFVMQIVMVQCQTLYGYTSTGCTGQPSVSIDIGTDHCYTVQISNEDSFSYESEDGYVMIVWGEDGCANAPILIYTQPGCIRVDGNLNMSFALINATTILEVISLRVAAIIKKTEVIARNCLCHG